MQYIGIDISKASIDVYDGQKSYQFVNNEEGFDKLYALLDNPKQSIFIYEPTGIYSYALSAYCETKQISVVLVGPKVSKDFARSLKVRSKTDKIDARVLYEYKKHIEPSMVKVPVVNKEAIKVQQMLNAYEIIQASIQRLKNQLEATSTHHAELLKILHRSISHLTKDASRLFDKIEALLLKDPHIKQKHAALCTIPAIGKKSAVYLLSFFMKYPDANAKKLTALAGLDPIFRESGTFKGKQKISKQGGYQLRTALFMPTLSALRHNDRLRNFYDRLLNNGKSKKLAVTAVMRKLILMAFSIFKSGNTYKPLDTTY